MKKREECTCPCHSGNDIIHFRACCEEGQVSTREQKIAWLEKHSDEGYDIMAGNPEHFKKDK